MTRRKRRMIAFHGESEDATNSGTARVLCFISYPTLKNP